MSKQNFMKRVKVTFLLLALTIVLCKAQSPAYWPDNLGNPTTSRTYTFNALGIGTSAPRGWQEVLFCPPLNTPQNGLVITKYGCATNYSTNWTNTDKMGQFWPVDSLIEVADSFVIPFNFSIAHNTTTLTPTLGNNSPLLWVRTETPGTSFIPTLMGGANQFDSKFIVMPDGSTGINIANPRAALDVRGSNIKNHPAAIIGARALGTNTSTPFNGITQYYTQHIEFIPVLKRKGYNRICHENDQGIFFTDGRGFNGSNDTGAFVIAPWAENNDSTVGGLRIDKNGNLELHGTIKSLKLKVQPKWWSDFVFDPEYELMTLTELDKYIKENQHLPGVPTTTEVKSEGIDVGDTQAILLQKLEELTLYIIAQDKKIAELQKLISK